MNQFYFLSIIFNLLAGISLSSEFLVEKMPKFNQIAELINGAKTKFVIGLGAAIIGFFKLLFPMPGLFFIGDFLPAIGGLGLGFSLLMDFLKQKSVINTNTLVRLDKIVIQNKTIIGASGIGIALLHFFFAGVPVL